MYSLRPTIGNLPILSGIHSDKKDKHNFIQTQ